MRRPYLFALGVATVAVAVSAVTAEAGTPYPPPEDPPPLIEPGTCVLEGHDLPPGPEAVDVVNLVFHCQLGDDSFRLFKFAVAADDKTTVATLAEVLERLGPLEDGDVFTPQFGFAGAFRPTVLSGCSAYNGGGVARSYCGGGLGSHRVWAVDNIGRVRYGPWVSAGRYSYAFPAYGYRFVSAKYQVSS
jgi:hypothetical protein